MKLQHNSSGDVISSGTTESTNFTATLDGKAFRLFSDTIYKDKIGSMVRELGCNAKDSHTEAGKADIPFEVHIPSVFEPYFSVKDFGVGLSNEDMKRIYSSYFTSTKTNSNNVVGAFGLGSKTPFSYTDAFTIISTYNGVRYSYAAMCGSDNVPGLHLLNSEETTDGNGFEVIINVKDSDFAAFKHAVSLQYRFFEVKPVITGGTLTWPSYDIATDYGKLHVVSDYQGFNYNASYFVVQGGVGYPLDMEQFHDEKYENIRQFFRLFPKGVIFVDIGDIEVTVSREEISYSTYSTDNIAKIVAHYLPIMTAEFKKELDEKENDYERLVFINSTTHYMNLFSMTDIKMGKNGNYGDLKGNIIKHWRNRWGYSIDIDDYTDPVDGEYRFFSASVNYNSRFERNYHYNNIFVQPNANGKRVEIILMENVYRGITNLKHYVSENADKIIYIVESAQKTYSSAIIEKLKNDFGGATIKKLSNIADAPKDAKAYAGPPKAYCMHSQHCDTRSMVKWKRVRDLDELDNGAYYFTFTEYPYVSFTQDNIKLIHKLMEMKRLDKPLIAIKDSKLDDIAGDDKFIKLEDGIQKIMETLKSEVTSGLSTIFRKKIATKLKSEIANYLNNFLDLSHPEFAQNCTFHRAKMVMEDAKDFKYLIDVYHLSNKFEDHYHKFCDKFVPVSPDLLNTVGDYFGTDYSSDLEDMYDGFLKKVIEKISEMRYRYPILEHIKLSSYYYHTHLSDERIQLLTNIVQYAKMVQDIPLPEKAVGLQKIDSISDSENDEEAEVEEEVELAA